MHQKKEGIIKRFLETTKEIKEEFTKSRRILSYAEYLELVSENPRRYLRDAVLYLKDMFDYFGYEIVEYPWGKIKRWKLFNQEFTGDPSLELVGQEEVQNLVYEALNSFVKEGKQTRLIFLYGPNGSSKTTFINCLINGLEYYSETEEGALYRFNWIFPVKRPSKAKIGFGEEVYSTESLPTYAYLEEEDIACRLVCELKDHPILLLPTEKRQRLIKEILEENGIKDFKVPERLWKGGLCHKCKQIYDALLITYKGDLNEVLRHVQVERYSLSRGYRRGIVTIGPQLSVDASERQITVDRSLTALPSYLETITLFEPYGYLVEGNGGIVEFTDLLKRPLDTFKYLISTIETGEVNLPNSILRLNTVLFATSNDIHFDAFREHPEYLSFKGRIYQVKVPYIRNYKIEKRIYEKQFVPKLEKHLSPHAIELISLWGVMTRLKRVNVRAYEDKVKSIVGRLNPLEKALLISEGERLARFTKEENALLKELIPKLYKEYDMEINYEGKRGASPRDIKAILFRAAQDERYKCLTPRSILERLKEVIKNPKEYPFITSSEKERDKEYGNMEAILGLVESWLVEQYEKDFEKSTGLVLEEKQRELMERYVVHVKHWIKGEKIYNEITKEYEQPDEKFMSLIEDRLNVKKGERERFRQEIISRIAAYKIEHKGKEIELGLILKDEIEKLGEYYYKEHKEKLKKIAGAVLEYLDNGRLEESNSKDVLNTINEMKKRGYCENCIKEPIYMLQKKWKEEDEK